MIDEEFYFSLPDDPEEAFPIYEEHIRKVAFGNEWEERENDDMERLYINLILVFVVEHDINIGMSHEIPESGAEFWQYYKELQQRVNFCSARFSIQRLSRAKAGTSAIYVLSPPLKTEIHHYLGLIRDLVAEAELSPQKRDALAAKLNAFAEEVDRDRTRLEALAAAWVWTKREIKDGVDVLNPVLDKIEKLTRSMHRPCDIGGGFYGTKPVLALGCALIYV